MTCPGCSAEIEAVNQHTACPRCGKKVGTNGQRDLVEAHARVVKWFEDWSTATMSSRKDAERDRDYYDGKQWTADEVRQLEARNQPVVVKNRIFKKINFLLGTEVRNRADPKALPRTPAHDDDVLAITDALRYVVDAQDFDRIASIAWEHELIEGYGGCVIEHSMAGEGDEAQVDVVIRDVPWDRLWYDLHSRKADYSDATHKGISTWWDLDEAVEFYSKRNDTAENFEEVLEQALTHSGTQDGTHDDKPQWATLEDGRKRILVSECYYRERGEWLVCHYTRAGFVVPPKPTGYLNERGKNVCPLEMASAFVDRDGMRYGLVRHMIGPQDEINKRSSKALHLLSVRQVMAEDGAVLDPDGARTEMGKPDGWIALQRDALKDGRIQVSQTSDLAQGQFQLLGEAKAEIDTIGPEIPQMANTSSGASGRALIMRQQIGNLELARLDDNHKRWKRAVYRQVWYRVRQFWPEEKWLRVRDDAERVGFRFVGLNRRVKRGDRLAELLKKKTPLESAVNAVLGPEGRFMIEQVGQQFQAMMAQAGPQAAQMPPEQQEQALTQLILRQPAMAEEMKVGDVAELDVDVVLDESPDASILQQEEYEQLAQQMPAFLSAKPEMAGQLLEMMIEASQLKSKKRLLEMLRKGPDPEQVKMAQMMTKLQAAQAQAGLQKTQADAQLSSARAAHEAAQAQITGPKAQADTQLKQAQAMGAAADAGHKASGGGL